MHPIEHLRHVARSRAIDESELVQRGRDRARLDARRRARPGGRLPPHRRTSCRDRRTVVAVRPAAHLGPSDPARVADRRRGRRPTRPRGRSPPHSRTTPRWSRSAGRRSPGRRCCGAATPGCCAPTAVTRPPASCASSNAPTSSANRFPPRCSPGRGDGRPRVARRRRRLPAPRAGADRFARAGRRRRPASRRPCGARSASAGACPPSTSMRSPSGSSTGRSRSTRHRRVADAADLARHHRRRASAPIRRPRCTPSAASPPSCCARVRSEGRSLIGRVAKASSGSRSTAGIGRSVRASRPAECTGASCGPRMSARCSTTTYFNDAESQGDRPRAVPRLRGADPARPEHGPLDGRHHGNRRCQRRAASATRTSSSGRQLDGGPVGAASRSASRCSRARPDTA